MESRSPAKNGTNSSPPPSKHSSDSAARNHRRRRLILRSAAAAAIIIVTIVIIAVILSQTVFKPKEPKTTVNDVSLKDLDVSILGGVNINVTVGVDLSIKNPNKVGFHYRNSTAVIRYRGEQVGEAAIPGGQVSAGGTEAVNLTVTIMADRLLTRPELYSDVIAGDLPLSAYTRITGKVAILGIFKLRVVSISSCDFNVNVLNRSITDQRCTYKTKL